MEVLLHPSARHTEMELRVRAQMDETGITGFGGRTFFFNSLVYARLFISWKTGSFAPVLLCVFISRRCYEAKTDVICDSPQGLQWAECLGPRKDAT